MILFAMYILEDKMIIMALDVRCAVTVPKSGSGLIRCLGQLFLLTGFLGFAVSGKCHRDETGRKRVLFLMNLLWMASILACFFITTPAWFITAYCFTTYLFGSLSGAILSFLAVSLEQTRQSGAIVGIGATIAAFLQLILQNRLGLSSGLLVTLPVFFFLTMRLTNPGENRWMPGERKTTVTKVCPKYSYLIGVTASFAIINFRIQSLQASAYVAGQPESSIWGGLFLSAGYLMMGFGVDALHEKHAHLIVLPFLFALLYAACFFFGKQGCAALFYSLYQGAVFSYVTLAFWKISSRGTYPELWAGMGRMLYGVGELAVDMLSIL